MPKPTPAQRRVLAELAIGWHRLHYRRQLALMWVMKRHSVTTRVAKALIAAGWVEQAPAPSPQAWRITTAGRAALEEKG